MTKRNIKENTNLIKITKKKKKKEAEVYLQHQQQK